MRSPRAALFLQGQVKLLYPLFAGGGCVIKYLISSTGLEMLICEAAMCVGCGVHPPSIPPPLRATAQKSPSSPAGAGAGLGGPRAAGSPLATRRRSVPFWDEQREPFFGNQFVERLVRAPCLWEHAAVTP